MSASINVTTVQSFPAKIAEVKKYVHLINKKVSEWNLTIVKKYLVSKNIYSAEDIDKVESEYKKFIVLCISFPQLNFAMARAIDEFWHCHVLFTEDYTKMCQSLGGTYLHHRPAILDTDEDLSTCFVENTLSAYKDFFGEPDKKYWDVVVCVCANNCCTNISKKSMYSELVLA